MFLCNNNGVNIMLLLNIVGQYALKICMLHHSTGAIEHLDTQIQSIILMVESGAAKEWKHLMFWNHL